jgi:hypothetical protein
MTPKQAEGAILISDKVDFKPKLVRGDKGHFILINEAIHEGEITLVNLYVPNINAPKFIKHSLLDLKTQIDPPTQWQWEISRLSLSPTDKSYRQRNSRIE